MRHAIHFAHGNQGRAGGRAALGLGSAKLSTVYLCKGEVEVGGVADRFEVASGNKIQIPAIRVKRGTAILKPAHLDVQHHGEYKITARPKLVSTGVSCTGVKEAGGSGGTRAYLPQVTSVGFMTLAVVSMTHRTEAAGPVSREYASQRPSIENSRPSIPARAIAIRFHL